MLGDDEHPISFLFQPELRGGHVHLHVRAGVRPHRALLGELVMRPEEWAVLEALMPEGEYPDKVAMGAGRLVSFDRNPLEIERPA